MSQTEKKQLDSQWEDKIHDYITPFKAATMFWKRLGLAESATAPKSQR